MIDVAAAADRLLQHVIDHFEAHGWELPDRRYVAAGAQHEIAVDDAHLLVSLIGISPGPSDATELAGGFPSPGVASITIPRAHLMLRLMRCVPKVDGRGRAPTAADLHTAGMDLLRDPGRMLDAALSWIAAERPAKTVTWGQIDPQGPEGGVAGHLVTITLAPIQ